MATIKLSLSGRKNELGRREILIRFFHAKINLRAKSEIFINEDFFEYDIDLKKCGEMGINVPTATTTATAEQARKSKLIIKESGTIVIRKRIETPEVTFHKEQLKRVTALRTAIIEEYEQAGRAAITGDWLRQVVARHMHPETYNVKSTMISEMGLAYIQKKELKPQRSRSFRVLIRDVERFETYVRATDKRRKNYRFDIERVGGDDIEGFMRFLKYEHLHANTEQRGENTIAKLMKELKAFFAWAQRCGITQNDPFQHVQMPTEKYGTPYYITIDERNTIADADMQGSKHLQTQRDIFVFQCLIGCRVSDLERLTERNITDGILTYTPHKTKDKAQSVQAKIPLVPRAVQLIERYRGVDPKGRLFPCISPQKYNEAIKQIFTIAGVTRNVEVRNPKTGENEMRPINELASSHIARRTFIGNLYFKVQDPSLIGQMSGHTDGSRAFSRYRKIENDTLREIAKLIE